MKRILSILFIAILFTSCKDNNDQENQSTVSAIATPANLTFSIINVFPHDTSSFTEGLIWQNGTFLESTGLEGHSKLLKTKLETGKILKESVLGSQYFGEGIAVLNNKIYQLTYKEHKVFVWADRFLR